jgi:hypothetical protein
MFNFFVKIATLGPSWNFSLSEILVLLVSQPSSHPTPYQGGIKVFTLWELTKYFAWDSVIRGPL